MAKSQTRKRHCKHSRFARLARRTGSGVAIDLAYAGTGDGVMTEIAVAPASPTGETWTVTLSDATNFAVSGSTLGAQAAGVVGTPYQSDAGEIKFLITAGATPFVNLDAFTFDSVTLTPFQSALARSNVLNYVEDAVQRLNLTVDASEELHDRLCLVQGDADVVGARSNEVTFEDMDAATAPADVGLT